VNKLRFAQKLFINMGLLSFVVAGVGFILVALMFHEYLHTPWMSERQLLQLAAPGLLMIGGGGYLATSSFVLVFVLRVMELPAEKSQKKEEQSGD
jgi:hypothetical protein